MTTPQSRTVTRGAGRLAALAAAGLAGLAPAAAAHAAPAIEPVRLPDVNTEGSANGIAMLPAGTDKAVLQVFQRTSIVRTPSGAPIHILLQRGVPPLAVRQARLALEEVLRDVPGSAMGADKSGVAEAIAAEPAVLMLFRNEQSIPNWRPGSLAGTKLGGMALLADQVILAGEPAFSRPERADTSLAAAVRLTFEFGIARAMPEYAQRIERATRAAIEAGTLDTAPLGPLPDLQVASIHFATAVEVYYGLWEGSPGPARGVYAPTTRRQLQALDPMMADLVGMFFAPHCHGETLVWPGLSGEFTLSPAPGTPGGARAAAITNATLTGRLNASLTGNGRDNRLIGNVGDNTFTGLGGDDSIDGGPGFDTAVYRGPIGQYHVELEGDTLYVIDLTEGRDGSDVLINVERVKFADVEIMTKPEG